MTRHWVVKTPGSGKLALIAACYDGTVPLTTQAVAA